MRIKNTLSIPIIILLVLMAGCPLYIGYSININSLRQTLEAREKDKAEYAYFIINSLIKDDIQDLSKYSKIISKNKELSAALAFYYKSGNDLRPLHEVMDQLYSQVGTDIFLVTDVQGRVLYRANNPTVRGDLYLLWGMEEALAGQPMMAAGRGRFGLAIRAMVPIYNAGDLRGVLMMGTRLNDKFAQRIATITHTDISFGVGTELLAITLPADKRVLVDPGIMEQSIKDKVPLFRIDYQNDRSFMYAPLRVEDEILGLVISSDTSQVSGLLREKRRQLYSSFLPIFLAVVALGSGLTLYIIRPLKRLQKRAISVIKDFSGEGLPFQGRGNEIQTLSYSFTLMLSSIDRHINDLRQIQEDLQKGERFLASVFDGIRDGLSVQDVDFNILRVNPAMERWYAHAMPLVGQKCYAAYHGRQSPCEICPSRITIETGGVANEVLPKIDGRGEVCGWLNVHSYPMVDLASGKITGVITYIKDISEQKRAEKAFKSLVLNAPLGIFIVQKGQFKLINPGFTKITGYSDKELIGEEAMIIVAPEFKERARDCALQMIKGERSFPYEYQFITKSGESRWAMESVTTTQFEGEKASLGYFMDVTEHKGAEENLELFRQRTELILNSAGEGIFGLDKEGKVTFINAAATRQLGYKPQGLIGQDIHRLIHHSKPDGTPFPREECPTHATLRDGEVRQVLDDFFWTQGGKSFPVEYVTAPLTETGELAGAVVVFRDVSERKELESQFIQAQKMEAVGRLAAGVAHDFNNMLGAIMGYAEMMMMTGLRQDDPLYHQAEAIKKAADRAAALTRQLLAFSRKQVLQPQVIDLNSVASDLEKMLRRLIGEDIGLTLSLSPDLASVKTDLGQMEQVIMNLVINARDAIPKGGKLIIETENVYLEEAYTTKHFHAHPGYYVMLAVSDNGAGIDAETQAHIFEPFFTTKEAGKGTGLGLSTVYGIVKHNGGHIEVYSELGRGTTFKIYLPAVEEVAAPLKAKVAPKVPLGGSETVLIVEDDEMLRELIRDVLDMQGYQVLEGRHGGEALLLCERHQGPIHLMLTDVVMPQMSGWELAERIAPLRPEMKVLFMSGYTGDAIVLHELLDMDTLFLQKPFSASDLASRVRQMLDLKGKEANK